MQLAKQTGDGIKKKTTHHPLFMSLTPFMGNVFAVNMR